MTHVPITQKTNFLFKKVKGYGRDITVDKEFLLFLGKLRNTFHTNFIYFDNDYKYKFGNPHFVFKDRKIVKWVDLFEHSLKLYFYITEELKNIWKEIVSTARHPEIILYLDNE